MQYNEAILHQENEPTITQNKL